VRVLAADSMEGRETGSEVLRRAEAYTVEQLKKSWLEPAGENGFYQTVEFDLPALFLLAVPHGWIRSLR